MIDVEAPVGLGDELHAVVDDEIEALVAEHRLGEFREVLLRELDHRGIDLALGQALHRPVLEHLLGDAAVAAADDQHFLGLAVREQRHVRHHLVIDELVLGGDLGRAVEHQHLAEELVLEQHQVLVLGLHLVEHALDLVGHAEALGIEQRLGNPALLGGHCEILGEILGGCPHRRTAGKVPGRHPIFWKVSSNRRRQTSRPRRISSTSTRLALKASRSTGMQASGSASPHMKMSSAA